MKFSACDAPTIELRRASRMGFLAHLSARESRVWDAFRGEDGACYLRFAPQGGPVLWMRQEAERVMTTPGSTEVIGEIAPPKPAVEARSARAPRPAHRTVIVGRYGSRQLFVYAGARAR